MRPRIGITSAPALYDERPIDRVNRWYVAAVIGAGGLPLVVPTLNPDEAPEMAAQFDGLLFTGGGDVDPERYHQHPVPEVYDVQPARDAWEVALLAAARQLDPPLPVLGICRGEQLLNVAAAGSLIQHLPATTVNHRQRQHDHDKVHQVAIAPGSRLSEILGRTEVGVNSVHHQAIERVGEGLLPVAWAPDGIVEAVETSDGSPVLAVQWHPEGLLDIAPHAQLFAWLARAAAARRPVPSVPAGFPPAAVVDEVA
ncbi:MAG: gamma-glutamyl-gamma-aminobutyrate hydrolase family protein [Acidimicrobiales bacterium]